MVSDMEWLELVVRLRYGIGYIIRVRVSCAEISLIVNGQKVHFFEIVQISFTL